MSVKFLQSRRTGGLLTEAATQPVYHSGELYVRLGNRKEKLTTQAALAYCRERWPQMK